MIFVSIQEHGQTIVLERKNRGVNSSQFILCVFVLVVDNFGHLIQGDIFANRYGL